MLYLVVAYLCAGQDQLRIWQDNLYLFALATDVLGRKVLEVYVSLDGGVHRYGNLAVGGRDVYVEGFLEEGTLDVELVIVGDNLMYVGFGSIKAVALLYLRHHYLEGIDGVNFLFLWLVRTRGISDSESRKYNK